MSNELYYCHQMCDDKHEDNDDNDLLKLSKR